MKKYQIIVLLALVMGIFISCDVAESDANTSIEDAIMRVIAADDSTYELKVWVILKMKITPWVNRQ